MTSFFAVDSRPTSSEPGTDRRDESYRIAEQSVELGRIFLASDPLYDQDGALLRVTLVLAHIER
jgi:hypothetical protein